MKTVEVSGLPIGDGHPPRIMGVLNVSEESPYDPSVFDDPAEAAAYVDEELIAEGADIVDVGLESANKRFDVLSADGELDRLDVAVEAMEHVEGDAVFSIETRYGEVADAALSRGFDMVNDVCGFADPTMPEVCAAHDAAVVKMASPPDLDRPGAVEGVDRAEHRSAERERSGSYADDVYDALRRGGLTEKTIVDPAFGGWSEAKTLDDDRETFRRLREFRALDRPILVSVNRKNFLRTLAGRSTGDALPVSLAATSMAVERGANVVRTHDVAETRDAALIGHAFARERVGGVADGAAAPPGEPRVGKGEPRVEELDVTTVREAARHLDAVGGDRDRAGGAVARAFRVTGLGAAELRRFADAADAAGVTVEPGDSAAFVAGTVADLRALVDTLADGSNRLRAVGAAVESACK